MKTKTSHTPIQWEVTEDGLFVVESKGYPQKCIACSPSPHEWSEATKNLIASAPDMLEALKCLTQEIHLSKLNIRKDFSLINAHACALKAIAKAEGK